MDGTAIIGIFAGYVLDPGYKWSGQYKVWALEDFEKYDLSKKSKCLTTSMQSPHIVKALQPATEGLVFPLKQEYDRANLTLEGVSQSASKELQLGEMPGDFNPEDHSPPRGRVTSGLS